MGIWFQIRFGAGFQCSEHTSATFFQKKIHLLSFSMKTMSKSSFASLFRFFFILENFFCPLDRFLPRW